MSQPPTQGQDYPQVGCGWAFPPRWTWPAAPAGGVVTGTDAALVATNAGAERLQEAMVVLLRTLLGSRVMRPGFGAGLDSFVFEPRTPDTCYRLADAVRRTLTLSEPRVLVDSVTAEPAGEADDRIDVTVEYRIDRHRRPTSLIVPFYVGGV